MHRAVCSATARLLYYLKWRYLANRLPLDNVTLMIKTPVARSPTVSRRRLAHKQDESCVCGIGCQGQQAILVIEKGFG